MTLRRRTSRGCRVGEPRGHARRADKGARSAPGQAATAPPRGVYRAVFSSSVALLFAFIAVTVAGMLWWQYREFYVSLDETDTAAADALARVRADQRALQDGLQDVNDDLDTLRERGASLGERLDALPGRFAALEERLDAVQGGSFDARGDLLRSEAEYYLTVANTELTLVGDYESAVTALELADSRLAEIGNPELAPVREAIAGELLALKSLRLPDIEGIVFSLGRLASRADELPLRADLPLTLAAEPDAELDAEPGFGAAVARGASARCSTWSASSGATTPSRRRSRPPSARSRAAGSRSSSSSRASRRCAATSKPS